MVSEWWHLENLQAILTLKIVTGEADLDEFDSFGTTGISPVEQRSPRKFEGSAGRYDKSNSI